MAEAEQARPDEEPQAGKKDGEGDDGKPAGGQDRKPDKPKTTPLWPWLVGGLVVLAFILLVLWIVLAPHPLQRTDDAYVSAHIAAIAPRVSGQVTAVAVNDNQRVRTGQLLVQLDDRDYRTSLAQADAATLSDQAHETEAAQQVARQSDMIRQARAQTASVAARLGLSKVDATRFANLAATGAGTVQQHQQADVARRQDQAALASAEANLAAEIRQLQVLRATQAAAAGRVQVDQAQAAQARLNLSYTRITAPIDGEVDQRTVQVGDYLSPGGALMTVVPLDDVYVMANYRELALRHMLPGQPVRIHVDAYNVDLRGVVNSIPAASGATYSPIPPNNATGNFTKIVQRLPVKIVFSPGQPLARLVRVGMSVETVVDTHLSDVVAEQRREGSTGRITGSAP